VGEVRPQRVRRRLQVGAADDVAEREADDLALEALARLRESPPPPPRADIGSTRIHRAATTGAGGGELDDGAQRAIDRERGAGRPLDSRIRRRMEHAFGADFRSVRVHVGERVDRLNERIQARAFTSGSDVFVRRDEYMPETTAGQALLAHELVHTLQQGAGTPSAGVPDRGVDPAPATRVRRGAGRGAGGEV